MFKICASNLIQEPTKKLNFQAQNAEKMPNIRETAKTLP